MACPAGDVGEEVAVWPNHGGRVSAASVPLASLKGHSSPVTAIRYGNCSHGHDDQEKMASASDDALLVWTLPGGGCIRVRSNCVLLTFVFICFYSLFKKWRQIRTYQINISLRLFSSSSSSSSSSSFFKCRLTIQRDHASQD